MSNGLQIIVCGGIAPDPLQRLEPIVSAANPALKNEMMLPAVIDPWAGNALYEAASLAKQIPGTKVYLLSVGPKAKLQQVMMVIGQKCAFELVAVDCPAGGFSDSAEVAALLYQAIKGIDGIDQSRLMIFGGWESATRASGTTLQMVGEMLGIIDQFQGVDQLKILENGELEILERVEGGRHQVSLCKGCPAVLGWATGSLPEPPNNPQIGMMNMRAVMPALQKAKQQTLVSAGLTFEKVELPAEQRQTRIVKDVPVDEVAQEIANWIKGI